jgi:hypothetical protein
LEAFIRLTRDGPVDCRAAPNALTLPSTLAAGVRRLGDDALNSGNEHGGTFGFFADGPPRLGILYGEGGPGEFNYSTLPPWPGLKPLGTFHTHLYQLGLGAGVLQPVGGAGGGLSGADLANFFRRDGRVSIVLAQRASRGWRMFLLLRPQAFNLPGTPKAVGEAYQARVLRLVERGIGWIEASDQELRALAASDAFAYYASDGGPILGRR